jgi:hypothetical protein
MGGESPIRTMLQQKFADLISRLMARSQDDLPIDENPEQQNDHDIASRVIGYLSSRELRPPEE